MRRIAAEALGTGLLLATVVGSGIMAERLCAGNVALALLCNTLPTAAMLVVLISVFGPISGAHMNPMVSGVMLGRGELTARLAVAYMGAQIAGAVLGVWLAHGMFDLPVLQVSAKARTGAGQWLSEAVAAFGLVVTILGAQRSRPEATGVMVGLYILAAYWFTASTSFANPAVAIARAFTDTFAGIAPAHVPAFIAAELAGAAAGAGVSAYLFEGQGSSVR